MHLTQLNMDFELEKNETSIYLLFLTFVRWEIPAKSVFLPNISKLAHGSWASGSCLVESMFAVFCLPIQCKAFHSKAK